MGAGEGDGRGRRAGRARLVRRAASPALLLALAVGSVQGLQALSTVLREDLASPPLVEVPPIDLGEAPPPVRPTSVAGAVVEAPPIVDGPATVDATLPVAAAAVETPATPEPAPEARTAPGPVEATPPAPAENAPGHLGVGERQPATVTAASSDDAASSSRRRHQHGPPPGRPVGPDCDDRPGRRAACDRRPPAD